MVLLARSHAIHMVEALSHATAVPFDRITLPRLITVLYRTCQIWPSEVPMFATERLPPTTSKTDAENLTALRVTATAGYAEFPSTARVVLWSERVLSVISDSCANIPRGWPAVAFTETDPPYTLISDCVAWLLNKYSAALTEVPPRIKQSWS